MTQALLTLPEHWIKSLVFCGVGFKRVTVLYIHVKLTYIAIQALADFITIQKAYAVKEETFLSLNDIGNLC